METTEIVARIGIPTERGFVQIEILRTGEVVQYKIEPLQNTWTEREAAALRRALRVADLLVNQ